MIDQSASRHHVQPRQIHLDHALGGRRARSVGEGGRGDVLRNTLRTRPNRAEPQDAVVGLVEEPLKSLDRIAAVTRR